MRLELIDHCVVVSLSARNIASLQHKLTLPAGLSARTLTSGDVFRNGLPVDDRLLVVRAETDAEHYSDPRRLEPPGLMHPATEQYIADHPAVGVAMADAPPPPWLRFDEHGELCELQAHDISRVEFLRWHERKLSLRLDELYLEITTIPAHGPFVVRSAAWSEAVEQPLYRNTLIQGAAAARLIDSDNAPIQTEAQP